MIQRFNAPGRLPVTVDWGPGRAGARAGTIAGWWVSAERRPASSERLMGQGKEDSKDRQRRWRERHPERAREQSRTYYAKHRDEINARRRERRVEAAEAQRRYYAKHRDEINARARERRAQGRAA